MVTPHKGTISSCKPARNDHSYSPTAGRKTTSMTGPLPKLLLAYIVAMQLVQRSERHTDAGNEKCVSFTLAEKFVSCTLSKYCVLSASEVSDNSHLTANTSPSSFTIVLRMREGPKIRKKVINYQYMPPHATIKGEGAYNSGKATKLPYTLHAGALVTVGCIALYG